MHNSPRGDSRSDAELIGFVRSGDPSAFGALWARHAPSATSMARYYAKDTFSADDLVSEAFERTYAALRAGGGPDVSFRAYLYTTVRRLAYENTERARSTRVTDDFTPYEMPEEVTDPAVDSFDNRVVAGAFASLPERWQAVLWYLEVERMKPADIAVILGLTANGVSALAYRAREGLREAYLQAHVSSDARTAECEQQRGKLGAYVNGTLSQRDEAKVENHLQSCDECTTIVAELRDVGHGLRVVIAPLILGGAAAAGLLAGAPPQSASAAPAQGASSTGTLTMIAASVVAVAGIASVIALAVSGAGPATLASDSTSPPAAVAPSARPTVRPTPAPTATPAPVVTPTPVPPRPVPTPPEDPSEPVDPVEPVAAVSADMLDLGDLVLGRDGMLGVEVRSEGDADAQSASLVVDLPAGVSLDAGRSVTSTGAAWGCTTTATGVTCSAALLASGTTGVLLLPVSVSESADTTTPPSATVTASGLSPVTVTASSVVSDGLGARFVADGAFESTMAGASFLTCDASLPGCTDAQQRVGDPTLWDNHMWPLVATTTEGLGVASSATQLELPDGAEVAFAGLYWSGVTPLDTSDDQLSQILLRSPDGTTQPVTARRLERVDGSGGERFQSFADVTSLVSTHGEGEWAAGVEHISAASGDYAGWALVVVYADDTVAPGRVAVFDGFASIVDSSVSLVIAGLPESTVDVGVVAWEGDAGITGDGLALDGVPLVRGGAYPDPLNVFRSDAQGSGILNTFGVDVGRFQPSVLSAARGTLTATTQGDQYVLGVVSVTTR
jgi:RNA polymerase sigma factor (sigma-70 family)